MAEDVLENALNSIKEEYPGAGVGIFAHVKGKGIRFVRNMENDVSEAIMLDIISHLRCKPMDSNKKLDTVIDFMEELFPGCPRAIIVHVPGEGAHFCRNIPDEDSREMLQALLDDLKEGLQ